MLTRLQVNGFKNLNNLDIRFGPFTCIAGPNGAGKSNIFDAIRFLSRLATDTLIEAASQVRSDRRRPFDPGELFTKLPDNNANVMSFGTEMVIPASGIDDLGQEAHATWTLLRYDLSLALGSDRNDVPRLRVLKEELKRLNKTDAATILPFRPSRDWLQSVISGTRAAKHYISTETDPVSGEQLILQHQDGGSRGRSQKTPTERLPRTLLSGSNSSESPTVFLAKREMNSWIQLQLEPTSLRRADEFTDPSQIGSDGSHLPATLYRLQMSSHYSDSEHFSAQVALRLSELIEEIKGVRVVKDDVRKLFSLVATDWRDREYPAQALSDGTLRFLALAVIENDPETTGTICLEEPENGIHPARIPAMVRLLQDIACSIEEAIGPDNPLRQVIVNTHSPKLVRLVPKESLLFVSSGSGTAVCYAPPNTWRSRGEGVKPITPSIALDYLDPISSETEEIDYATLENDQYLFSFEKPPNENSG